MAHLISRLFATAPPPDADVRYRFQLDMTHQLAASTEIGKGYQSIAMEVTSPPSPLAAAARPSSRSSVFPAASSSPTSAERIRRGTSRIGSDASTAMAELISPRSRAQSGGSMVETKEGFFLAASRRQSMAVRVERRVNLAREDVSYETLEDDEMQVYEYLEFVRELLDGLTLKKICQKSGRVVSRKLYITPDMQVVFWNSIGIGATKRRTQKSSIRTELIESVQKGLHGSVRVTAVSSTERDARCVSIRCSDGKCLALEAKTEALRQRLYFGFSRLAQEHNQHQDVGATILVGTTIPEKETEDEAGDDTSGY
ncbi:hypothetical protein PHMEG_0002918 [Phytophthora megakarya]|uniref:Uncharacterized protein n=1 Tax=Phytophthora megakarya TaxID=4795 RepID=A0A225WZA5_9STRA|nr:hypothetical protein PHMEG_0002918 [Phytophthora megakarya]